MVCWPATPDHKHFDKLLADAGTGLAVNQFDLAVTAVEIDPASEITSAVLALRNR